MNINMSLRIAQEQGCTFRRCGFFQRPPANIGVRSIPIGSDARSPDQVPDSEHLALLEMRGDRVFKTRNFSAGCASH